MKHTGWTKPNSAEEWDYFLFSKYGYGLYPFCCALAIVIRKSDSRYGAPANRLPAVIAKGSAQEIRIIRERIKRKNGLKKRIFAVIKKDYDSRIIPGNDLFSISHVDFFYPEVAALFKRLDGEIDIDMAKLALKSVWNKKGHPSEIKNRVASIFAHIIKNEKNEPDWICISWLLSWLRERIKNAEYYSELNIGYPDVNNTALRSAHNKIKKDFWKNMQVEQSVSMCFSEFSLKRAKKIIFYKQYISFSPDDTKNTESQFPTIVFPDGTVLGGMFSLADAAKYLCISDSTFKKNAYKGRIKSIYIGPKEIAFSRTILQLWGKKCRSKNAIRE